MRMCAGGQPAFWRCHSRRLHPVSVCLSRPHACATGTVASPGSAYASCSSAPPQPHITACYLVPPSHQSTHTAPSALTSHGTGAGAGLGAANDSASFHALPISNASNEARAFSRPPFQANQGTKVRLTFTTHSLHKIGESPEMCTSLTSIPACAFLQPPPTAHSICSRTMQITST